MQSQEFVLAALVQRLVTGEDFGGQGTYGAAALVRSSFRITTRDWMRR
jgi:hypothetical protein